MKKNRDKDYLNLLIYLYINACFLRETDCAIRHTKNIPGEYLP